MEHWFSGCGVFDPDLVSECYMIAGFFIGLSDSRHFNGFALINMAGWEVPKAVSFRLFFLDKEVFVVLPDEATGNDVN